MPDGIVAITGATGFVGRHLVPALLAHGQRVRVLARRPEAARSLGDIEVVEGAIEDVSALRKLCKDASVVIHCAAVLSAARRDAYVSVNGLGTSRLVVAAREAGVKRFILLSSLAAREPEISDYAASKRAGENVVRRAGEAFSWIILRAPAVYGPGDRATLGLFRQLSHARAYVPANARNRFSLIHVADLAEAIVAVLEPGAADKGIHELHDGKIDGYSWQQLAEIAGQDLGRKVKVSYLPRAVADLAGGASSLWGRLGGTAPMLTPGKVREFYHVDWVCRNNMLDEQTSWAPSIGFREGFAQTLDWYAEAGWLKVKRRPKTAADDADDVTTDDATTDDATIDDATEAEDIAEDDAKSATAPEAPGAADQPVPDEAVTTADEKLADEGSAGAEEEPAPGDKPAEKVT